SYCKPSNHNEMKLILTKIVNEKTIFNDKDDVNKLEEMAKIYITNQKINSLQQATQSAVNFKKVFKINRTFIPF
ncbi:TPA: hypothetical protein ACPIWX_001729, partial [Haemophilus influenzae]